MALRYWVGGSGTWNTTSTLNWAATSGGAGGQSAPTAADDVVFDTNSGSGITVTCSAAVCANLTASSFNGTFSGTLTLYGGITSGASVTWSGITTTLAGTGAHTVSSATLISTVTLNSVGGVYSLANGLSTITLNILSGGFVTNNYGIGGTTFTVSGTATCSVNLGSSLVEFRNITFSAGNNFTFVSGTSLVAQTDPTLILTINTRNPDNAPRSFYDVDAASSLTLYGLNTFRNVTVDYNVTILDDQTITGVLTLDPGTVTARRALVGDEALAARKTLTVASLASGLDYWDFSDVAIAGAVGTLSGPYFGDRGNNSGITFPSPKTVYWVGGTGQWFTNLRWALTSGGAASFNNIPLAQDTVVIDDNSGVAGLAITGFDSIDTRMKPFITTLDMSTRTLSASVTGGSGNCTIHLLGDLTLGYSGCTVNKIDFNGHTPQTITTNGGTLGGPVTIFSPSSVNLSGACNIVGGIGGSGALQLFTGTLNTNNYNLTITSATSGNSIYSIRLSSTWNIFTFNIGSSTVSFSRDIQISGRSIQFTGVSTGKLQFTHGGSQTFRAGTAGIRFPTVNNANSGIRYFTGNANYYNLTNSYKSTGTATFQFAAGSFNSFTNFDLAGEAGRISTLTSTSTSGRALLAFENNTPINVGATSIDAGNNYGVLFTGAGNGYLSVSYINSTTGQGGFFLM